MSDLVKHYGGDTRLSDDELRRFVCSQAPFRERLLAEIVLQNKVIIDLLHEIKRNGWAL